MTSMLERNLNTPEARLRASLAWHLAGRSPWREPLMAALAAIGSPPVYLFGGLIRDVALYGAAANPRDVDLVVAGLSVAELGSAVRRWQISVTSFGGLELLVEGTRVDIWRLEDTWAFRKGWLSPISIEFLPKTTYLKLQAVVAQLRYDGPTPGVIHQNGFYEALNCDCVEINCANVPAVETSLLRAVFLAEQLGRRLGPQLRADVTTRLSDLAGHVGRLVRGRLVTCEWLEGVHRLATKTGGLFLSNPQAQSECTVDLSPTLTEQDRDAARSA